MSDVNIPLLRKAVEWAESEAAKPAIDCRWYQGAYLTPPTHLAHRLVSIGEVPHSTLAEFDAMVYRVAPHCGTAYCIAGWVGAQANEQFQTSIVATIDGIEWHVDQFAAKQLGLAPHESSRLFEGANTIEDVRSVAEDIAGERL